MARNGVHAHGCTRCAGRYEDTCDQPQDNALCRTCQGFDVWQLLHDNRLPRDCCYVHSRLMTKDERRSYRLSAGCPWFRCTACCRTFPYRIPQRSTA